MRLLIAVLLLSIPSSWAQANCMAVTCGPNSLYVDSITGQNNCYVEERVACQFQEYSATFNRLIGQGWNRKQAQDRLKNQKKILTENINLKGLLTQAERKYKNDCQGKPTGEKLTACFLSIDFAKKAYQKADQVARHMGFPKFSHRTTIREMAGLFQIGEKNKKRFEFFSSEAHNIEVRKDITLWRKLKQVIAESKEKSMDYFICNDGPYKVDHIVAEQRLVFLSGLLSKKLSKVIHALNNLETAGVVEQEYKKRCEEPDKIQSHMDGVTRLKAEIYSDESVQKFLINECLTPTATIADICKELK